MIYLLRLLSCPGISTRTCNGYVAGRGHVYTAQRSAASEIPIWLGRSQHTYVEQRSTMQKYRPEVLCHVQARKGSARHRTCTADIPATSRVRAGREIFALTSAVRGWQRWLRCLLTVAKRALLSAPSLKQMQKYCLPFPPPSH